MDFKYLTTRRNDLIDESSRGNSDTGRIDSKRAVSLINEYETRYGSIVPGGVVNFEGVTLFRDSKKPERYSFSSEGEIVVVNRERFSGFMIHPD